MSIDKATIINWALTELGVGPVFDSGDDSDLALQVENTWQRTVEFVFALDDWNWSRKTVKLTRLAEVPDNGWSFGFALPANRIGQPQGFLSQAGSNPIALRHFTIEGRTVFANVTDVWARIRQVIAEDDWDVDFRSCFVKALAGNLAVPVFQDKNLADRLLEEAFGMPSEKGCGGMFGRLMAQNKAAEPLGNPLLANDPLSEARHTGGDPYFSWAGRYG